MRLSTLLKKCLQRAGLTQTEVAKRLHVKRQTVNAAVNGRQTTSIGLAEKILRECGYRLADCLHPPKEFGTDDKEMRARALFERAFNDDPERTMDWTFAAFAPLELQWDGPPPHRKRSSKGTPLHDVKKAKHTSR